VTAPIRALIVDDEPLARRAMRTLLVQEPGIAYVGEARDGPEAVDALRRLQPELVFLDIRLPGLNGLAVLAEAQVETKVVFTTAHDSYAIAAFELGAIDYLRKPFGAERLHRAIERAVPQVLAARRPCAAEAARGHPSFADRLAIAGSSLLPRSRIFVRQDGRVLPVRTDDIARCEADGDYVIVHALGERHQLYLNLGDLADQLDTERFIRVHRSHLVNLDHVTSLSPRDATRLIVHMRDGGEIVASRAGTLLLRRRYR
jgi:two-component system LytT family response regulator